MISPPFRHDEDMLKKAYDVFDRTMSRLQNDYSDMHRNFGFMDLELLKANEELRAGRNYLDNVLQALTDGVIVVDRDHTITYINHAASGLIGITSQAALDNPLSEVMKIPLDSHLFCRLEKTGEASLPGKGVRKGIHICYILSPLMDLEGEVMGWVIVFSDLTKVKRLEKQAQLSRRLSSMGEMAASLAHEIRNPLGSLELFGSLLRRDLERDADKASLVDNILMVTRSLANITANLLSFARPCTPVLKPLSVDAVLDETLVLCWHLVGRGNVELVKEFATAGHLVDMDGELIKQAFLNIILNALQAMENGGRLTISTARHSGCTEIKIADTGPGIDQEYLDKIFDPFFTTRERGTGLGLAIVHSIVRAHNGTIDVRSEKGRGTLFLISLTESRKDG